MCPPPPPPYPFLYFFSLSSSWPSCSCSCSSPCSSPVELCVSFSRPQQLYYPPLSRPLPCCLLPLPKHLATNFNGFGPSFFSALAAGVGVAAFCKDAPESARRGRRWRSSGPPLLHWSPPESFGPGPVRRGRYYRYDTGGDRQESTATAGEGSAFPLRSRNFSQHLTQHNGSGSGCITCST